MFAYNYSALKTSLQTFVTSGGDNTLATAKMVTSQAESFSGGLKQAVSLLAALVRLVFTGGSAVTAEDITDGELSGGIVLLLSPLTNQAHCRGTLTVRQGTKCYTTQRAVTFFLEPADLTPVQIALAALYLRTATFSNLKSIDGLVLKSILDPVTEEDFASFKQTLKSNAVESAVRRNLEARLSIHRGTCTDSFSWTWNS